MSLHIGNLPSNIRKDDLHRVFWRFGRCTIRVKDKYGFVVYDYPASAEKALKTLRGQRICGEAITVSWSKQQPRTLQRFDRRLCSYDQGDKEMDSKKAYGEIRIDSSDLVDESISKNPNESKLYVEESSRTFLTDHQRRDGARKNLLEDDRWGEHENSVEFDRYEPHHSDGQKEFDEHKGVVPLAGSSSIRRKEFRDKKRNRREYDSQDKNHLQRATGPSSSSSIPSDYTLCRSKSSSKKKLSSFSLGPSPSHYSRSETFKSPSTSRSMSPTTSPLPSKVIRNVSSSPKIRQKDYVGNTVGLSHTLNLFEDETKVTSYTSAFKPTKTTLAVENECETRPVSLEYGVLKKDPSEKDNEHSRSNHQVDNLVLQTAKGMSDSQNKEHDNSLRYNSSNSLRMSSEEVCTILKHYGLKYPEVNEKNLPVEVYFGSARLWPWEIIYYRRLKKGPISTENYSRRIAQNEEFGIVDKYIRGSSGWGELDRK